MTSKIVPSLWIGAALFFLSNATNKATEVPINYDTNYDGIVNRYDPIPQLPSAIAVPVSDLERNAQSITNQLLVDAARKRGLDVAVPPYSNGYLGHENTLVGDMIHQMRHEGKAKDQTLNYANDILSRCAKLADPKPPICN